MSTEQAPAATFKVRDVVEVTPLVGKTFYGLVSSDGLVVSLDTLVPHPVQPEWCRLVAMTLVIKDGEWRLE